MLDIIIIMSAGGVYFNLANEFNKKNPFLYGVLGAVIIYGFLLVFAFILGIVVEILSPGTITTMSPLLLTIICVPFGILAAWVGYRMLKKRFEKVENEFSDDNVLDAEFDEFE